MQRHLPRGQEPAALERTRGLLESERFRVATSAEMEGVAEMSRYALARQFRQRFGVHPNRYRRMRQLDAGEGQLLARKPIVESSRDTGFDDRAHFTRACSARFRVPPARYRKLT